VFIASARMSLRGSFAPRKPAGAGTATDKQQQQQAIPLKQSPRNASSPPSSVSITLRSADRYSDADRISSLLSSSSLLKREDMIRCFGNVNFQTMLASSVLSLVVEDASTGSLLGFLAVSDSPVPGTPWTRALEHWTSDANHLRRFHAQEKKTAEEGAEMDGTEWKELVEIGYKLPQIETNGYDEEDEGSARAISVTPYNSLWLRYFLLADDSPNGSTLARRVLESLFDQLPDVDYLLTSMPRSVDPFAPFIDKQLSMELPLAPSAGEVLPQRALVDLNSTRLLLLRRQVLAPPLKLRTARIEDHDDLVPIFDAQSEVLTSIYGEFFLATLIQSQNEHQRAIVAEKEDRAVGLMGVTDEVDVKLIQRCFDLEAFDELRKQKTAEEEAMEEARKKPLKRMHRIFATIMTSSPPLSQAEKEKMAISAMSSKRGSFAMSKRGSFNSAAGGATTGGVGTNFAAVAGMLKSEAAPASSAVASGRATPVTGTRSATPQFGPEPDVASSTDGSLSIQTIPSTPTTVSIDPTQTFPAQWLLNYIETFKPDPQVVAQAQRAKQDKEEAERLARELEDEEDEDGEFVSRRTSESEEAEEEEEPYLVDPAAVYIQLQQLLGSTQSLDVQSFCDVLVALLGELPVSIGSLLRFLELATKTREELQTKLINELPEWADGGTAASNVFAITLFCIDQPLEKRSKEMLQAAFDLYPDRSYCLLTLPHTSPPNSSPNLLRHFTLVAPTPSNTFGHVLYLLHRDTLQTLNQLELKNPEVDYSALEQASSSSAALQAIDGAAEANTQKLLAEVTPLIAHLPNAAELKREITAGIRALMERRVQAERDAAHATAAGVRTEGAVARSDAAAALLAKKQALELQIISSQHSPTETLLISCLGSVVGVILFNRLSAKEVEVLRSDFGVDDLVAVEDLPPAPIPAANIPPVDPRDPTAPLPPPKEHLPGSIHINVLHIVLNPLFHSQLPFLCRELLRKAKAHVLYYQVWSRRMDGESGRRESSVLDTLPSNGGLNASYEISGGFIVPQIIQNFIQVRPRRKPAYMQVDDANEDGPMAVVAPTPAPLPCSLYLLTRPLLSRPRTLINTRIALVGCSRTALACLEHLLLDPSRTYTNLILLSKDGLVVGSSGSGDSFASGKHFLPGSLEHTQQNLDRLNLACRIRIIRKTMVNLKTDTKNLLLDDGSILPYDILLLAPGLQNQLPITLMRQLSAQALAEEIRAKAEAAQRRKEALRDAKRRKKAQEQGLDDISTLDAETLARVDEELDREEKLAEQEAGFEGADGDESGDAKSSKRSLAASKALSESHRDWQKWLSWSASGLERWEAEYGSLLDKQRALAQGTLDPHKALALNAQRRELAAQVAEDPTAHPNVDRSLLEPSALDLTPYGISGIYAMSSEEHVAQLIQAFQKQPDVHQSGKWVVDGATITALTTIQGLIEMGVPPRNITWLHSLHSDGNGGGSDVGPSSITFLDRVGGGSHGGLEGQGEDDPLVLQPILAALANLGINIRAGIRIKHVKQEEGNVYAVVIETVPRTSNGNNRKRSEQKEGPVTAPPIETVELPIVGLIGCGNLDVDPYIFRSVHASSLVYDGRLVVNHCFQTALSSIYAAGPVTKFSRDYGRKVLKLEEYNSAEVGRRLAEAVVKTALEEANGSDESTNSATEAFARRTSKSGKPAPPAASLPALGTMPKVVQALLPGNLFYFHAHTPTHRSISQPQVLVTQRPQRICRLVFNDYHVLHSITLLLTPPASCTDAASISSFVRDSQLLCQNLVQLIGLPASYMNCILFQYQHAAARGGMKDLVDFLSEQWSVALYHDSFFSLRVALHAFLTSRRLDVVAIIDRIIQTFTAAEGTSGQAASASDPFLVSQLAALLPSQVKDVVQRSLLRWLRLHENQLPDYAMPKPFYAGPQAKPKTQAQAKLS